MQIGDNLHEISNPVIWEKKKKISPICHLLNLFREWERSNVVYFLFLDDDPTVPGTGDI